MDNLWCGDKHTCSPHTLLPPTSSPSATGGLVPTHTLHPLPRMVTFELSRVLLVEKNQRNEQDMQFTRRREKLVKSRKTALGAFRKRSVSRKCIGTFCVGKRATSSSIKCG